MPSSKAEIVDLFVSCYHQYLQDQKENKRYYWPDSFSKRADYYLNTVIPCYKTSARLEYEDQLIVFIKKWADFVKTGPPKEGTKLWELFSLFEEPDHEYYGQG